MTLWVNRELGLNLGIRKYRGFRMLEKAEEMEENSDAWLYREIGWNLGMLDEFEKALEYLRKAEEMEEPDDC